MAVEKDKVLAAIELKFKGKSITKTFKENIAAKWAAKIDNDTDIDDYINDREDVILEAVSEADRRATDAVKKATTKPKEETETKEEEKKVELPDDTPAWAKVLLKNNEALEAKIAGFEKAQSQKTIAERFRSDERLKGVPEFAIKGRIPSTEEEFEAAVTELQSDFSTYAEENKITTFGKDRPGGMNPAPGKGKEASKEEIDVVAEKMGV